MAEPIEINHLTKDQVDNQIDVHSAERVTVIPEGGDLFTVQIRFEDPPPAPKNSEWANTKRVGEQDFHSMFGGQEWRYDSTGVFLRGSATPERTQGAPVTCATIVSLYGKEILKASLAHGVPPELIVMTIAAESAADRGSNFTGPKTFRWEAHVNVDDVVPPTVGDYSAGPMQTLATTAREIIRNLRLPRDPMKDAPPISKKPDSPPDDNPLYAAELNIDLGAAEIRSRLNKSGFDPILVAACYNHGSLAASNNNAWGLVTHGDHLNRASQWYGDACAVLEPLRRGVALESNIVKSPMVRVPANQQAAGDSFELSQLTKETADAEMAFYRDADAAAELIDNGGGLFTVRVRFPPRAEFRAPVQVGNTTKPDRNGYVVVINRIRTEKRPTANFFRTIGFYQGYFNRAQIPGIEGIAVERQGPGDNSTVGKSRHSRLAEGMYPLFTHSGGVGPAGFVKYKTMGFSGAVNSAARPWPSIRVENTRNRSGVLIHCAFGYLMSEGCINLASNMKDASSDIVFADSRSRVIALINSMKNLLGASFPTDNNSEIENAFVQLIGEP